MPSLPRLKNSDNFAQWATKINDAFTQFESFTSTALDTTDPQSAEFAVYDASFKNKALGNYYVTTPTTIGELTIGASGISNNMAPGEYGLIFTGGAGTGATGVARLSYGSTGVYVSSITLANSGTGYTSAPTVTIAGATGFTTNYSIIASSPYNNEGDINVYLKSDNYKVGSAIQISAGSGYGSTPTVTISNPPFVVGATGFVGASGTLFGATGFTQNTIVMTTVGGVPVTGNAQYRFYKATKAIADSTQVPYHSSGISGNWLFIGRRATATAALTSGAVSSVTITDKGYGYTSTPATITFSSGSANYTAKMYSDAIASLTTNSIYNKNGISSLTDVIRSNNFILIYDSISDTLKKIAISVITPDIPTGALLFGSPTDSYIWNVQNLYWDNTNNRLGIGTNSPDALLTVNGVGSFGDGTVSAPSITNTGDLNTGFWFPAADTIAASTGGSERVRIDSTGNVGIGSTNPLSLTHINGSTTAPAGELGNLLITTGSTAKRLVIGVDSSGTMYSWIQSIENAISNRALSLNPLGGNVGIGTSTPGYRLDVTGDINISTGSVYRINGTSVLSSTTLGTGVLTSSLTAVGTITTGTWNANLIAGQYGGTGVANTGKTITVSGNTVIGSSTNTVTINTSGNTTVTLPTTGNIISDTGSYSNPSWITSLAGSKITGSINVTGTITATTFSGSGASLTSIPNSGLVNSGITINGTLVSLGGSITISAGGTISPGGSDTHVQYNSSGSFAGSANLTFDGTRLTATALTVDSNTGTDPSLFVDNTNNRVGIGTNTPTTALQVVGTVTATTFSGSGASLTNIPNSAVGATSGNTLSAIVARDSSGNFTAGTITATLNGNAKNITDYTINQNLGTSNSPSFAGLTVDTNVLYVDATNNRVGIGTITPSTTLQVVGTVTATTFSGSGASLTSIPNSALVNSSITINGSAISLGGSVSITAAAAGSTTQVQYNSSGSFAGSTNLTFDGTRLTAAALTVDSNAGTDPTLFVDATNNRVGIGTSTPNNTLQVAGTIAATTFSGSGASLTNIPNSATTATTANTANTIVSRDSSGNFTAGTITATINATTFLGTTSLPLNRSSANQALTGITSISLPGGTSGTAILQATAVAGAPTLSLPTTTGTLIVDSGSYSNPSWITSLSGTKITGDISGNAANISSYTINQNLGTSNSPSFAGLTVDTNTLYVDATNDRIGVGTTSPSFQVDIQKSTGDAVYRSLAGGTIDLRLYASQTYNVGYIGLFSNHELIIMQNTTERMRFTNGGINVNGNLSVSGTLTATLSGYVDTSTTQTIGGTKTFSNTISGNITGTSYNITQYTINQNLGTSNSPSFAGLTVDTNTLYVDATNDRVGVGTTTPQRKLHINAATADTHLYLSSSGPSITLGDNATFASNTMQSIFALATSASQFGQNAGTLLIANYGNSRNNIVIDANYSGTGTKDVVLQPTSGVLRSGPQANATIIVDYIPTSITGSVSVGYGYTVNATGITLTLPTTSLVDGDRISFIPGTSAINSYTISGGGNAIMNTDTSLTVDLALPFDLIWNATNSRWVLG